MTFIELKNRIWDALGKPSDLDPATDIQYNNGPLLDFFVNEGQRQIAFWRDPILRRRVQIRSLFGSLNYCSTVLADAIAAVNNDTFPYYIDLTSADQNDDQYNDWLMVINGEAVLITDYDGANRRAYIHKVFETAPEIADTVDLYKNFDFLVNAGHAWVAQHISLPVETDIYRATGNLIEVLSITDLTNKKVLKRAVKHKEYIGNVESYGDPTEWYRYGNRLVYDYHVDSDLWFKMEYYRAPTEMTDDADEPEIPLLYHMGIVLWGIWNGLIRTKEASMTQLAWKNLVDFMRATYGQDTIEDSRLRSHGVVLNDWR